jgi:uncharacterized membrane protein
MSDTDASGSLGNGAFELSDIPEAAGKLADGAGRQLREAEIALLLELRRWRRTFRKEHKGPVEREGLTLGQRIADQVAATMGSWRFIIVQSMLLTAWVVLNITAWIKAWDPYPFILLNLALSFQAAYAAPIIMMSQNRQGDIDRKAAENDYKVNIKSELEIELLHQKLDKLRQQEVLELTKAVQELSAIIARHNLSDPPPAG